MKVKASMIKPVSGVLVFFISALSMGQQNVPGAVPSIGTTSNSPAQLSPSAAPVDEQTPSEYRAWTVKPRISLTETLTDHVSINSASTGKQSDLVTELVPGIRAEARTSRFKGHFDYSLRGQVYLQNDYSRTQNSLNAFGTLEAVENLLFLDFSGVIAQQAISAFGAQSPSNATINSNSRETATYRLSPYIRGQLGGLVDYLLRYNLSTTRSQGSNLSDIDLSQWVGQLKGSTPFRNLGWTIDANQQTVEYSNGRKTDADTLRAMGTYTVLPQFRVSLSGGRESNNYASLDQETHNTYGYGFEWTPTERTRVSTFKEKRFFGDGHNISFSHRFPRSSIRFTDSRDVSVLPNQFASVGLGTFYDLFFEQYSSVIPDPVVRAAFVNALLQIMNINPNQQATSSFLASRANVQRRQQLALALTGVRNTITLLVNRNENQSVFAASALNDDFTQSNVIHQQGFSLNLSHRLSDISNLNVLASRQETTGTGANINKTTMTMLQVNVSTKLGAKTTGSVSARRSEFESTSNPYTENALIGMVSFIY